MTLFMLSDQQVYTRLTESIGLVAGIYRLRVLLKDRSGFVQLSRIASTDPQGILYIGASLKLPVRVASLRKALDAAYCVGNYKDPGAHPCGTKLQQNDKLRSMFRFDDLCVTVDVCDQRDEDFDMAHGHYRLQWDRLQEYCNEYGEYPPLNG